MIAARFSKRNVLVAAGALQTATPVGLGCGGGDRQRPAGRQLNSPDKRPFDLFLRKTRNSAEN